MRGPGRIFKAKNILKEQRHKIFHTFLFNEKNSSWAPYEQSKQFRNFFVFTKIFAKNVCPRSLWLRLHNVIVVVDYIDTLSE